MPEAIKVYRDTKSWLEVARVKESILDTYFADFGLPRGCGITVFEQFTSA